MVILQDDMVASLFIFFLLPSAAPVEYVPGEYIVQLRPDLSSQDVMERLPGALVDREFSIGALKFASVTVDKEHHDAVYLESNLDLDLIPNVVIQGFTGPDPVSRPPPLTCYEQKTGEMYWGLTRISQDALPAFSPDDVYLFNDTGQCVDIYVMDTGVNVHHETFEGRARAGYTAEELLDTEGSEDMAGHGTHVAGLAAGRVHGVAKHANIISVKVFNSSQSGSLTGILAGFDWISNQTAKKSAAGQKVRSVINMSWGFHDPIWRYELLWDIIHALPAVAVAAAGNNGIDACQYAPARFDTVLTVSSTDKSDKMVYDYGHCVDVLAPGVDIHSASYVDNTADSCKSGTSMSAGLVSGVIARHLEHFRVQPTTEMMRKVLQETGLKGKTNAEEYNTPDLLVHISCNSDKEPVMDVPDWDRAYCSRQKYNGMAVAKGSSADHTPGAHPIVGLFVESAEALAPSPVDTKPQVGILPHVPLMLPRLSGGMIVSGVAAAMMAVMAVVAVTVMCRCRAQIEPCAGDQAGTTDLVPEATPNASIPATPVVESKPSVSAKQHVVQSKTPSVPATNPSIPVTLKVESKPGDPAKAVVESNPAVPSKDPTVETNPAVHAENPVVEPYNPSVPATPVVESNPPVHLKDPTVRATPSIPATPIVDSTVDSSSPPVPANPLL